uniref:Maturase K n=1 Tax=Romanomermis culicivorax TaxID=13658 RepID=A0A915K9K6_ROMCU
NIEFLLEIYPKLENSLREKNLRRSFYNIELQILPQISQANCSDSKKPNFYHYSTNRRILQQLKCKHKLPGLISDYRRLYYAYTSCILRLKEKFEKFGRKNQDFSCSF